MLRILLGMMERETKLSNVTTGWDPQNPPPHTYLLSLFGSVLITQPYPTIFDPMDCSLPGSSVHGILQARILVWVAICFSRGSSRPRDWTQVSHIAGRFFTIWTTREARIFGNWDSNRSSDLLKFTLDPRLNCQIWQIKIKDAQSNFNFISITNNLSV